MKHGVFFFLAGLVIAFLATGDNFTMWEQAAITIPSIGYMFAGMLIIRAETQHE